MASVLTLNALHPTLTFHVGDDHTEHVEDGESEEQEGRAMERMNEEDAEYVEEMEEVDSRENRLRRSVEYTMHRTESPGIYDIEDKNPNTQAQPLSKSLNRTVTINEPNRDSLDKPSSTIPPLQTYTTPIRASSHRRSYWPTRTLSFSQTNTLQTYDTFTSFLSTSWSNRHDPSHPGFWSGTWNFLIGKKLNPDGTEQTGPSDSDPDYIPPKYRWIPILSGLLQPFSILLEIPGLTEHWYVRTINNVPVAYQSNPALLDVGLAISMACAVIANIALISRFLERRVFPATMITIIGLSIHDLINIIAVTIFGVVHRFDDGFTYSEAFWLCVCSTVASMTTNATLIYDLIHTKDFKRSGSGLTAKQRSLVIIVMILLVYIALGSLCFNFLLPVIPFQNCLYYTVVCEYLIRSPATAHLEST
jgi:potassium channel subfamily K